MTAGAVLALIKSLGGGGGGGLPSVTSVDNGKVLTVEEGAWAAATPSGGGGALMVGISPTETGLVMNKTWNEIFSALSNSPVFGVFESETQIQQGIVVEALNGGSYYTVTVEMYDPGAGGSAGFTFQTDSEDGNPEFTFGG